MAETIIRSSIHATREQQYATLLPQLEQLTSDEPDLIANLANIGAALRETFGFLWIGFYLVKNNELVLGPFQGPLACTRIAFGKGVCGTAWKQATTIIVPDVEQFPGHIACSSLSRSEIVVPILLNSKVLMVLDMDSEQLNDFSSADQQGAEAIASLISTLSEKHRWFE